MIKYFIAAFKWSEISLVLSESTGRGDRLGSHQDRSRLGRDLKPGNLPLIIFCCIGVLLKLDHTTCIIFVIGHCLPSVWLYDNHLQLQHGHWSPCTERCFRTSCWGQGRDPYTNRDWFLTQIVWIFQIIWMWNGQVMRTYLQMMYIWMKNSRLTW